MGASHSRVCGVENLTRPNAAAGNTFSGRIADFERDVRTEWVRLVDGRLTRCCLMLAP